MAINVSLFLLEKKMQDNCFCFRCFNPIASLQIVCSEILKRILKQFEFSASKI